MATSTVPDPAHVFSIISAICDATILLVFPVRLWKLRGSAIKNALSWHGPFKAALGILLAIVLSLSWIELLGLDAQQQKTQYLGSLSVSILAALCLSLLLFQEQRRSDRASDSVTLYLLASILCDVMILAAPSSVARHAHSSRIILFRCCIHATLLLLGCYTNPRTACSDVTATASPEERHGILSRMFFVWINPILLRGYTSILVNQDLPNLSHSMKPEITREAIIESWSKRAKPETKLSLPLALMRCLQQPFLAAIVPRLLLIFFRYSQTILIRESIRYVEAYPTKTDSNQGFWLVLSAVTVYVGLALSTGVYEHRINRLKLMTRSSLVGLIHDKTINSPAVSYDDGQAITLMSTDADSLDNFTEMIHEIWAQVVEVIIGVTLLAIQVGWIWPLPLFLIYLCSYMSRFVAKNLRPRQKAWNNATQNRMAAISSMLSTIKVVKMLGYQNHLMNRIRELRKEELWAASRLRWVMVYYNMSANALGIFSPAITLVIFALVSVARGGKLDTETAFTTIAILSMVTHPANMVMTIVPRAVAAFAGFDRIQKFLLQPSLQETRQILSDNTRNELLWGQSSPAIQIHDLRIGRGQGFLHNINIEIAAGSFAIISGPTGGGKTTLLRAILGEVTPVQGSITLSTRNIAYCAQKPWLPNGTIKDAICGITDVYSDTAQYHERWYHEIIEMCCLAHDFETLPYGDQTQIGSKGLNLSGGQRQRVALARALFAKCDILLLDDTFSGLDGGTEQTIFNNLFGPSGLIRHLKTTVVLVSNSYQYFHAADHIVVLKDHEILDQGNWHKIQFKATFSTKLLSSYRNKDSTILAANFEKLNNQLRAKDETELDLARQTGDPSLYGYYFSYIGFNNLSVLIGCTILYSFFITFPQYWLQLWTDDGSRDLFYACGFLLLSTLSWASTSTQMWSILIRLAPQSGSKLHERLLYIVTSAPLSYFSKTDVGSILNRFSQDMQLVDKQLPSALQTVVTQIFKLLMQIVLLCVAEKWLALSLPACVLLVYVIQKDYLRTSRQLRFLELESRAGVFSNFLETVEGLETIRSFGWSKAMIDANVRSIDDSQRPDFLLLCLQRWLKIVLDLLAAAIATSAVAIAVTYRDQISGAQVGIALNIMLVANTTLLKLVGNWTSLEISLGAISRLKSLEETTPFEGGHTGTLEPPENWPSRGHIEFKNITASYQSGSVALRNLSLNISAGQRLMICGRTGSGKSTLILTLLRLLELQSGKIELDGIDIKTVGLDILRQQCFIAVSQDPLLLPNETLRFNLDPDGSVTDDDLVDALTETGLWSHFFEGGTSIDVEGASIIEFSEDSDEHPVLHRKFALFQELSVGQCQLLALCRALVKAKFLRSAGLKPVIILDEATSSLDIVTESTVHKIVDREFTHKGHTVIIVTHRLGALEKHMEVGRDAVALIADGKLQEVIQDKGPMAIQLLGQE